MTAYGLIYLLAASVSAEATFGDVKLWWSDKQKRLYLQKNKPCDDAKEV